MEHMFIFYNHYTTLNFGVSRFFCRDFFIYDCEKQWQDAKILCGLHETYFVIIFVASYQGPICLGHDSRKVITQQIY